LAVGPATGRLLVGVVNAEVALLQDSKLAITALRLAICIATIAIHIVSIIARLTHHIIGNTVTAEWNDTVGPASVGSITVQHTTVTLFLHVNDSISTISHSAVRSASVWQLIVVHKSIITLFFSVRSIGEGHDVFLDSVSTSTLRCSWKTIQKWLKEFVGGSTLTEEDGESGNGIRSNSS